MLSETNTHTPTLSNLVSHARPSFIVQQQQQQRHSTFVKSQSHFARKPSAISTQPRSSLSTAEGDPASHSDQTNGKF